MYACRLALNYYILYYNNKNNSDKPYIAVVVCLLVMLNQWKQVNLLFIQLQRDFFCGAYLVSARERPIYCWSQNPASLTRCAWQSQLLPNRDCDFISINRAALSWPIPYAKTFWTNIMILTACLYDHVANVWLWYENMNIYTVKKQQLLSQLKILSQPASAYFWVFSTCCFKFIQQRVENLLQK